MYSYIFVLIIVSMLFCLIEFFTIVFFYAFISQITKAIERGPPRTSRRVVSNIVNLVVNQWLCLSVVLPHCCQPIVLSHVCLREK